MEQCRLLNAELRNMTYIQSEVTELFLHAFFSDSDHLFRFACSTYYILEVYILQYDKEP